MEGRDYNYYDARAQDVALDDITSSAQNAEILRGLRDGETTWRGECLDIAGESEHDFDDDDEVDDDDDEKDEEKEHDDFIVRDGDDIGWLGYFIGRNEQVQKLCIHHMPKEKINALMREVKHNRSVEFFAIIEYFDVADDQGDDIIDSLSSFIIHNSNLKELRLCYVDIGRDGARNLALALNQRQQKSLTRFFLKQNNLGSEGLAEITAALSGYKQLESLYVSEDLIGRDQMYYDTLAQIIDLECITSSKQNAETLRMLRDDDLALTWGDEGVLYISDYESDYGNHFCAQEDDDWGWLGYFIGRSKQIRELHLYSLPLLEESDTIDAFMEGLNRNQSIVDVRHDIEGDAIMDSLSSFIINNNRLTKLDLWNVNISLNCARSLALALNQRQQKSLTRFSLNRNHLGDEGLAAIAASLSGYPYLESLGVLGNLIGREGCVSLGAIVRSAALRLKEVFFSENDFDDEGFQILAAALANTTTLQTLSLSKNRSITAAGLRALSLLFRSASPLETLYLKDMNIGDDGAEALAAALAGNTSLKHLVISPDSAGITQTGWSAFLRLLCDTSSINNTYQSNHTLVHIGDKYYNVRGPNGGTVFCSGDESGALFIGIPPDVARCLKINKDIIPHGAAKFKIGWYHPDFPVEAFFEHKLKFLPLLVSWFIKLFGTRNCLKCQSSMTLEMQKRELSAVYKFIRGMPMLAVDGYCTQRLKSSCGKKRKFDE